MYKQSINEIQRCLPSIDPDSIELASSTANTNSYLSTQEVSENIYNWAISQLEKAKLPTDSKKIRPILNDYEVTSDEGCALRIILEYDAMQASLKNNDANTAVITGMKIFEMLWQRAIDKNKGSIKIEKETIEEDVSQIQDSMIQRSDESDEDIKLYQETINEMQHKYPNCNVNALRLLVATRLNVSKQQLDELRISPE